MPNTGVPLCNSAIRVPQIGKPAMKDFVPSIGSSTQTYSASSRSLPNSSPTDAVLGEIRLDQAAHHRLRSAIGLGDRIEIARALVVDRERGAKERQNGFAGCGGEAADEGCEIDDRHGCSLPTLEEECRHMPSSIRADAHRRPRVIPIGIANSLSNRVSQKARLSVDFWLVAPSRSCDFLAYQHCSGGRGLAGDILQVFDFKRLNSVEQRCCQSASLFHIGPG